MWRFAKSQPIFMVKTAFESSILPLIRNCRHFQKNTIFMEQTTPERKNLLPLYTSGQCFALSSPFSVRKVSENWHAIQEKPWDSLEPSVVVSSSVSSMFPSSSWYLRRRCVRVREVSCKILSQCSLKCGGRGVRLCFVICRFVGAMFFRRWCVMRSAWDLWAFA